MSHILSWRPALDDDGRGGQGTPVAKSRQTDRQDGGAASAGGERVGGGIDDGLSAYRAKRSADRTGEPFDAPRGESSVQVGKPAHFVVQKHAARRLHWDLRLEIDGVLRSWAVPRGPSLDPSVKRLAVQTEDHPLDYVDFEGVIPAGNYGAGAMIVWDRGVWVPREPIGPGYEAGKLLFELRGHKLRGVWTLVRTKEADGRQWLLIKKPDGASAPGEPSFDETSILSGLTIEELRDGAGRAREIERRLDALGVPREPVDPKTLAPMLAQTDAEAFDDPSWVFELKYDGYRLIACKRGESASLRYRSGRDATHAFPEITRALAALPYPMLVLDGEVVVLDDDARPNFQRLQKRAMLVRQRDVERAMREHPAVLYLFDVLGVGEHDARGLELLQRKALLRELLPAHGPLRFADHIFEHGNALLEEVRRLGVEGIVAKRADSRYVSGRSPHWRKIRVEQTHDFVIVGHTMPDGSRTGFGALHLAAYDGDELVYCGRVGTGFDEATLTGLRRKLDELEGETFPLRGTPRGDKHIWVEPVLVAEIRYKHMTDDGLLRHPVFLRLRDDKPARDCPIPREGGELDANLADESEGETEVFEADPAPASSMAEGPAPAIPLRREVVVSNPDKVFWPEDGLTKSDLVEYYQRISPWLLPYLRDRPLVLTRYPDGIDGKNFFQKNAPPYVPDWVRTKVMWSEHAQREIEYFVCEDVESLVYVVNLATIPLHVWGSRLSDLQHPDWCILDLDPKGAPFDHVIQIARTIHELCEEIELPALCKTSGSTGLHVLVPLGRRFTFEQCRMFGEVLALVLSSMLRDIATIERHVPKRKGKVYIDYLQNGHGRLLVSPFCVRPLPGAPVSMPLAWDEVGDSLDPRGFDLRNAPARMAELGQDPMAAVLTLSPDLEQVLQRLLVRLDE